MDRIEGAGRRDRASRIDSIPQGLIFWTALIALAAIFGVFGYLLYAAREDRTRAAWTASTNIATTLSQEVRREIELLDLSLLNLRDGAARPDVMALPPQLRAGVLFDRSGTARGLGALLLLDASGRVVQQAGVEHPAPIDLSGEPFFRAHLDASPDRLFVSHPFVSLVDGETSIALSRRVTSAGAMAGVAVATIKLSHIEEMFARLALGPSDTLMLEHADGTTVMRRPSVPAVDAHSPEAAQLQTLSGTAPAGSFPATSPLDGVTRQYFYSRLDDLPLALYLGRGLDDIHAAWRVRAIITAISMLVLGGAILGLVAVLQVELRRRKVAEAALSVLATTDTLTGLANRREFDARLDAEWMLALEARQPVGLVLLDIDHFKALNDQMGHQAGDAVLAALGRCLGNLSGGPASLMARYGGEEFVLLLPRTDAAGALRQAEKIRSAVRRLEQPHPTSPVGRLTVSIGLAVAVPCAEARPADLLRRADVALYEAKRLGRDRVAVAGDVALAA